MCVYSDSYRTEETCAVERALKIQLLTTSLLKKGLTNVKKCLQPSPRWN